MKRDGILRVSDRDRRLKFVLIQFFYSGSRWTKSGLFFQSDRSLGGESTAMICDVVLARIWYSHPETSLSE